MAARHELKKTRYQKSFCLDAAVANDMWNIKTEVRDGGSQTRFKETRNRWRLGAAVTNVTWDYGGRAIKLVPKLSAGTRIWKRTNKIYMLFDPAREAKQEFKQMTKTNHKYELFVRLVAVGLSCCYAVLFAFRHLTVFADRGVHTLAEDCSTVWLANLPT